MRKKRGHRLDPATGKPTNGTVLDLYKPTARSRVTNNREILPGIDHRSPLARRYRDLVSQIAADQGGADHLSESRLQLIRRFSGAAALAEQVEARLVEGEQIDIGEYARLTSTLIRVSKRLGLDRIPRNVTPTLEQYLADSEPVEEPAAEETPNWDADLREVRP
jgi:hypothetical protein